MSSDAAQWECEKCTFVNESESLTCVMCYTVRSSTRELPYTWQWLAAVDWIPYDGPSNDQIEAAYQAWRSGGPAKINLTKGWFADKKGEYTVSFGMKPVRTAAAGGGVRAHIHAALAHLAARANRGPAAEAAGSGEEDDDDASMASSQSEAPAAAAPASAASAASSSSAANMQPDYVQHNNHSGMTRKVRRLANDDETMFTVLPPSATPRDEKCSICAEEWWQEDEAAAASSAAPAAAAASKDDSASAASAPAAAAASSAPSTRVTCIAQHPSNTWPSAGLANVKLKKCMDGHSFHRDCIAAWIKLKDCCPMCKTQI